MVTYGPYLRKNPMVQNFLESSHNNNLTAFQTKPAGAGFCKKAPTIII